MLSILINWASNVAKLLLNAYRHHHAGALHIFAVFVSVSAPAVAHGVFGALIFIGGGGGGGGGVCAQREAFSFCF